MRILDRGDLAESLYILPEHVVLDAQRSGCFTALATRSRPVLNLSTNPLDIETMRGLAQQIWGPGGYLMLGWDAHGTAPDLVYWPYFLLCQRLQVRQLLRPRRYRISMLSGIPRPHRIQLWRDVRSRVRAEDMVVINRFASWSQHADLLTDLPWSNHPHMIEPDQERALTAASTTSTDHPAYRACVNLPLETVWDTGAVFVTEKTWKALVSGAMPWHGCAAIARYLQDLGFEDWFQETQQHTAHAQGLFDREDLWQFYHDHEGTVRAAQDRFWADQLITQQTQAAIARLENWAQA